MYKNSIVEFTKTKNRYKILQFDSKMKDPTTRKWLDSVIYQECKKFNSLTKEYINIDNGKIYVREKKDFLRKFELILDI